MEKKNENEMNNEIKETGFKKCLRSIRNFFVCKKEDGKYNFNISLLFGSVILVCFALILFFCI